MTNRKKPSIVGDCLAPLADRLQNEIVERWDWPFFGDESADKLPPEPRTVAAIYDDLHLENAVTGLRVLHSVALADDLERRLKQPREQFAALQYRACQILDGDPDGTIPGPTHRRFAFHRASTELWVMHDLEIHLGDPQAADSNRQLHDNLGEQYAAIGNEFRAIVQYVRQVCAALRSSKPPEPELTPTDTRNKFCYEEWQRGQTYKQIFVSLKQRPEWDPLNAPKAVRSPINTWAKKHALPVREGQPGKPKRAT